jgi:hypothetical protein
MHPTPRIGGNELKKDMEEKKNREKVYKKK